MVKRVHWVQVLESAWERKTVLWLSGVRRVGKTVLCQTLEDVEYLDCELPRVRRQMQDPEGFLSGLRGKRVVLDEVHRLQNPSELLKVAADHYPQVQVLATGSSTLQAAGKFRDTLAGRKADVWLTPMLLAELDDFGNADVRYRLQRGGLPPFFLSETLPDREFQEWMDSYWARDIQELFRLERRSSFQRFVELVLAQSGGIFEATRFTVPCEIHRRTVSNYLAVLQATWVAHVVRPYSTLRSVEIVAAPKVYAFDTGFTCYYRGWRELRPDDLGLLWEHLVLNEIHARSQSSAVHYWRDKHGHEVDFVLADPGKHPSALECKWSASDFNSSNLRAFRRRYPEGANWVVAADVERPFVRRERGVEIEFLGLEALLNRLGARR